MHIVSNAEQLHAALKAAKGGDTIELKSGVYEGIDIRDMHFDSAVTITSQNPDDPAVIHNKTYVENSSNLTFDNLEMLHAEPQDGLSNSSWKALFYVTQSSDITLSNSKISGAVAEFTDEDRNLHEGFPFGAGVRIRSSEDITITGNEITSLFKGVGLDDTDNVVISNNHIHKIRVDGVMGTDHTNTLIEENLFENFTPYRVDPDNPSGATDDHSDMIQYWGTNADIGVHDFTIRDNVFLQDKIGTQTIFGRMNLNSTDDSDAISFTNFEISGNLIYNGQPNGITLSDVTSAKVFNNTVLANEIVQDDFRSFPMVNIRYDGERATSSGFDINSSEVQASRDVDVFNNVLSYAHEAEVTIRAFSKKVNDRDEVKAALNITEDNNFWLSTRFEETGDTYESVFKLSYEAENGMTTVSLDERSADLYGDVGSAYYTKPEALENFFGKLNTGVELNVNSDLKSATDAGENDITNETIDTNLEFEESPPVDETPSSFSDIITTDLLNAIEKFSSKMESAGSGRIRGDNSDDEILGSKFSDFITSDEGDDLVDGGAGDDRIYGNNGRDLLSGGDGSDILHGGSGEDVLVGGDGEDILQGGTNDDLLIGGSGNDTLLGGGGDDIAVISGSREDYQFSQSERGVFVASDITGEIDEFIDVEYVYFMESSKYFEVKESDIDIHEVNINDDVDFWNFFDDLVFPEIENAIEGDSFNNRLVGTNLQDKIYGEEGNDRLRGLDGNDSLYGGTGNDALAGHEGEDYLNGGLGNDKISGGPGNDILIGGKGNDDLNGGSGLDTVVVQESIEDYEYSFSASENKYVFRNLETDEVEFVSNVEYLLFAGSSELLKLSEGLAQKLQTSPFEADYFAAIQTGDEHQLLG